MKNNKVKLIIKAKKELSPEELKVFNESLSTCLNGKVSVEAIKPNLKIMQKYLPYLTWNMKDNFNPKVFWETMRQLELSEEMLSSYDNLPKELLDVKEIIHSYIAKIKLSHQKIEPLSKKQFIPFKESQNEYTRKFIQEAKKLLEEINSSYKKEELEKEKRNQIIVDSMFYNLPEYEKRKKEPVDPLDKVNIWHRRYIEKKLRDKELVNAIIERKKLKKKQSKKAKSNESLSYEPYELTESQIVAEYFIKKMREEL